MVFQYRLKGAIKFDFGCRQYRLFHKLKYDPEFNKKTVFFNGSKVPKNTAVEVTLLGEKRKHETDSDDE